MGCCEISAARACLVLYSCGLVALSVEGCILTNTAEKKNNCCNRTWGEFKYSLAAKIVAVFSCREGNQNSLFIRLLGELGGPNEARRVLYYSVLCFGSQEALELLHRDIAILINKIVHF